MANLNGHEGGNAGHGQGAPNEPGEGGKPHAEGVEGRGQAKGNASPQNTPRTQSREGVPSARERIRQAAEADKGRRFTALLHHVYDIKNLREAYFGLKRDAAPGVDGETWRTYGEQLDGFRPGRSPHDALDALCVGIQRKKVSWVLDADIRGFFDAIDHECLVKFIEHRIADRRVVRLIQKWLSAGVLEDGKWTRSDVGTPQGGGISPLLANVYLHYAFDLWVRDWRRQAKGDVIVVRFADDFIVGFQYEWEARRFWDELRERLAAYGLELHPDKTRLLEFGRFAAVNRRRNGRGKPETFDFLGFTHVCGKTRKGRFTVLRLTMRKRLRAKLLEIKTALRLRWHDPVPEVGNG
jgi:hypothetical protein